MRSLTWFWAAFLCLVLSLVFKASIAHARQVSGIEIFDATPNAGKANDARSVVEKILPIGTRHQNNIPLLNNRFRIDDGVDKVILVFFREFGAQPVVIVRPDGSKLYLDNDMNDDSYHWYESDTYDMIELVEPTAGPWQALGQILPGSQVMVIADLTLESEAIPSPLFAGESIKHTAFLRNAGEQVNFKEFRDVVSLSIDFISTNHPDYENFGLGTKNIARFEDNAMGFDETSGDGTFTGEFDLNISNGEWQPVVSVRTPLFSREQSGEKVLLLPNPVTVTYIEGEEDAGFHKILVNIDPEHINPESLMVDGTIRSPEGEPERFSLTELGPHQREISVVKAGYGMYRSKMTVFAQTLNGRDVRINVPEFSFITREPEVVVAEQVSEQSNQLAPDTLEQAQDQIEEESQSSVLALVISINLIVLLIGTSVIYVIADKRKRPNNHIILKLQGQIKGLLSKITSKKPKADKTAKA